MRRSRTDLRARVNGDLQLEFADVALTSYAGLELFGRYLRTTGFNATVRAACAGTPGWGDFGAVAMVRLLIGLLVVGGRRLRPLAFVEDDPLFRRFCEVQVVPPARTVSRWRQGFTMTTVADLHAINTAVIARVLATLGCARGRSMSTAWWYRQVCRLNGPSVGSIPITERCRVTTQSWRTWPRRPTCGG